MKKLDDNDVANDVASDGNSDEEGTTPGWWMAPGPVLCSCCEQPHHVEAMVYCRYCDGMVCSVCVVVSEDSEALCPECFGAPGDF